MIKVSMLDLYHFRRYRGSWVEQGTINQRFLWVRPTGVGKLLYRCRAAGCPLCNGGRERGPLDSTASNNAASKAGGTLMHHARREPR